MPEISIAFQTDKTATEYIALAQQINAYPMDVVTVYCDPPYHPSFMPLMLMAPHIEHARIGVAAIPVSRIHPMDIAAQIALLHDVSQAGVYVGVARGAWLSDHGIKELQPPVTAVREAIEVIRYYLSGKTGGYQGKVFQIAGHASAPYPLPDEAIPILVGTWGPMLSAIAGEIADEVKIGGSANPDMIPVMADYLQVGEERAGHSISSTNIVIGSVTVADEDRDQARAAARRSLTMYLPVVAALDPTVEIDPDRMEQMQAHVNADEIDEAAALISDDILDRFAFAGNADDLIRQAESLYDAGAFRVEFGTPHGLKPSEGLRIIGEEVIPAIKANWSK